MYVIRIILRTRFKADASRVWVFRHAGWLPVPLLQRRWRPPAAPTLDRRA